MTDKHALRAELRARRKDHEAAIPPSVRGLLFMRPPIPLLELIPPTATVAVYDPVAGEASPLGYARWLVENGRKIALPWFAQRGAAMQFRMWDNPFDEEVLVKAPHGGRQPPVAADEANIDVAIVPLLGFTERGERLGQGAGHYDRYLADHPAVIAIGLAWDCQLVETLPTELHDVPLSAVVTPTRIYGPF